MIIIKHFLFFVAASEELHILEELRVQHFKFPSNVLNSYVSKALLWVYIKPFQNLQELPADQRKETTAFVVVYEVAKKDEEFKLLLVNLIF